METDNPNSQINNSILAPKALQLIKAIDGISKHLPVIVIIHNITTGGIISMSELGLHDLKITLDEITKLGNKYVRKFLNPYDLSNYFPQVLKLFKNNKQNETFTYFQQARANSTEDWRWYLSSTKILMLDENNNPYLSITTSKPIYNLVSFTYKIDRILDEKEYVESNSSSFNQLTKREKQIIALMADGKTTIEMAKLLNIAAATIEQHRKNIRKKLQIKNLADLLKFAQAFDML